MSSFGCRSLCFALNDSKANLKDGNAKEDGRGVSDEEPEEDRETIIETDQKHTFDDLNDRHQRH